MPTPEQAERLNSWCAGVPPWVYTVALELRLMYGRIKYARRRGVGGK